MSEKTVLSIEMRESGLDEMVNKSATINKNLKEASQSMQSSSTSSSRALMQQASAPSRAQAQAFAKSENEEYNRGRSTGGTSARDFANQSAGMGGIVRLYATFAANIFAVSAAYEALAKASATVRLSESTDRLAESTGANLKLISKELKTTAGDAITFQEAMQFGNMAASAGLAGKQVNELVKIAKGAANVLGRDSNDAIKRIIQGTVKQEQEILDELGIFVKAKDLYDKYAKQMSIKGGADALSAAQKVKAYADGVAEAGKKYKEFADVEDPFSKFSASSKEAITEILNTVNKLLGPFLGFVSTLTNTLTAAILSTAALLAKKAIPKLASAISDFGGEEKRLAEKRSSEARNAILTEYKATTDALKDASAKREQILATRPTFNKETIRDLIPQEISAIRGQSEGISAQRLSTKLLGRDGSLDLTRYSALADIEKEIASVIKAQVKDKKEAAVFVQKLVDLEVLATGATEENLILGTKSLEVAKAINIEREKANAFLLEEAFSAGNILALEKEKKKLIKEGKIAEAESLLSGATPTAPKSTRGPDTSAVKAEASKVAAEAVALETAAVIENTNATAKASRFTLEYAKTKLDLAKASTVGAAAEASSSVARIASIESMTTFGSAMRGIGAAASEAGLLIGAAFTAKISSLSDAFANMSKVLGASAGFLGVAFKGLMRNLFPILLAVDAAILVWDLFGDKIKKMLPDWMGFSEAAKAASEALEKHSEAAGIAGAALAKLNAQEVTSLNSNEMEDYYKRKGQALDTYIESLKKQREELNKASSIKFLDKAQQDAEALGKVFSKDAFYIAEFIKNNSDSLSEAMKKDLANLSDTAQNIEAQKQKGKLDEIVAVRVKPGELGTSQTALADIDGYVVAYKKVAEVVDYINSKTIVYSDTVRKDTAQKESDFSQLNTAAKVFGDTLDTINKKAKPELFKHREAQDLYEKSEILLKAFDNPTTRINAAKDALKNLNNEAISKMKFPPGFLEDYKKLLELLSSGVSTDKATEILKNITKLDPSKVLGKAADTALSTPIIRPYDDKSLALLRAMKGAVSDLEAQIKLTDLELASNTILNNRLKAIQGYTSEVETSNTAQLESKKAELEYQKALTAAGEEYQKVMLKKDKHGFERDQEIAAAKDNQNRARETAELTRKQALYNVDLRKSDSDRANILAQINLIYTDLGRKQDIYHKTQLASLDVELAIINAKRDVGTLTNVQAEVEADANKRRTIEENRRRAEEAANTAYEKTKAEKDAEYEKAVPAGSGEAPLAVDSAYMNAMEEASKVRANAIQQADIEANKLKTILDIQKTRNDYMAALRDLEKEHADQLDRAKATAISLGTLFGTWGAALGSVLDNMTKITTQSEINALNEREKLDALIKAKAITDASEGTGREAKALQEQTNAQKEYNKAVDKSRRDRLTGIQEIAKVARKDVAEQSASYKVLTAVQKAAATEQMLMEVKKAGLNKDNMTNAGDALNALMQKVQDGNVVTGIGDVLTQGLGDPWTAIPRMLKMASFVSGLTGKSIKPPAIDQGTLAGTGQQVGADGRTIGTRAGGVLGDPKATAKSITDSINDLSKVFFGSMGSQSSLLIKHLRGIQENTYDTAKALGAAGYIGGSNPFGVTGLGKTSNLTTGIGIIDNLLGSLFGSTTRTVTGSGITASGTASSLAAGRDQAYGYTNIHTEDSGFLGIGGGSSDTRVLSGLDQSVQKSIRGMFQNFSAAMLDSANSFGKTQAEIMHILDTKPFSITVSNVGLTATEFAAKLQAEMSIQLNAIAEEAYPIVKQYIKVGEESFQVAARIIKDGETVTTGLMMVGKAITGVSGAISGFDGHSLTVAEDLITKQQDLIQRFGTTVDDFAAAIQGYYDAIFSESEKSQIQTAMVQSKLAELGVTTVTTKDQLRSLIDAQDLNTASGREMYASLVKLAPAFATAVDAANKMQESMDNLKVSMYDSISSNIGNSIDVRQAAEDAATVIKQNITMKNTDPAMRILQAYVFSLDNLKTAEARLAAIRKQNLSITKKTADDQLNILKTTVSSLDSFIISLKNFNNSLLVGAQSPLSPADKYSVAKQQFSDILATATGSAITPEQQKAKEAALNQIQGAATAFLDASKLYNASSDQYSLDFNLVQSSIVSTTDALALQKDAAQQTVDILTAQSLLMQSQLDSMDSVVTAVQDTTAAVQAVADAQAAANVALQTYMDSLINVVVKTLPTTQTIAASTTPDMTSTGYASNSLKPVMTASQLGMAMTNTSSIDFTATYNGQASGGVTGLGMHLVGEHGPELIDYTTPGRIYTANDTEKLFAGTNNNQIIVAELRALRVEVQQLREQQRTETGHLINATYDSQNQNAQAVTDAVTTTSATQIWANKVQNAAVIV
jgi:hypothetical protein